MKSEKTRHFDRVPIITEDNISIEFCRLGFSPREKSLEILLWVSNRFEEPIEVWIKEIIVNGVKVSDLGWESMYFDTYGVDDRDYSHVIIDKLGCQDICSYKNVNCLEFAVTVIDAECVELYCSSKIKILCDIQKESYEVVVLKS